jgi:hypothetical protein
MVAPGVTQFGGADLDSVLANGEGQFTFEVFDHDGPVTLTLDVEQQGAADGVERGCPSAPQWEGSLLHVPVKYALSSSDGYLRIEAPGTLEVWADGIALQEDVRRRHVTSGFGYASASPTRIQMRVIEEGVSATSGLATVVHECYRDGDGFCLIVYGPDPVQTNAPQP